MVYSNEKNAIISRKVQTEFQGFFFGQITVRILQKILKKKKPIDQIDNKKKDHLQISLK